jgi:hypothetical protein
MSYAYKKPQKLSRTVIFLAEITTKLQIKAAGEKQRNLNHILQAYIRIEETETSENFLRYRQCVLWIRLYKKIALNIRGYTGNTLIILV